MLHKHCLPNNHGHTPQLWQQTSSGPQETFVRISEYKHIKGTSDKLCNQFKQGGSGDVEEKECSGNEAIAICAGKYIIPANWVLEKCIVLVFEILYNDV